MDGNWDWRLALCGFGLHPAQATQETLEVLRRCDVVFSDALDEASAGFVRRCCAEVRLLPPGPAAEGRRETAEAKVRTVMEAVERGARVAVLNYGHPTFLSSLSDALIRRCRERGVRWRAYGAVSTLDAVLATLGLSGLWGGLHVYDADDFAGSIAAAPLRASVPTLVVKIGYLLKPEQAPRLRLLLGHLRASYPPGHPCALVESPWLGRPCGAVTEVRLDALEAALRGPNEFVTLYLPPWPEGAPREVRVDADADSGLPEEIERARRLACSGAPAAAAARLSELLAREPGRVDALEWRARSLLALGRASEALRDADEAVRLAPDPGWRHELRAEARLAGGDPAGCLSDAARAGAWAGRDEARLAALSCAALAAQARYAEAEELMQESVEAGRIEAVSERLEDLEGCLPEASLRGLAQHARRRLAERPERRWLALFAE